MKLQFLVGRPEDGRDLADRDAKPGLALPERVFRPLRLDRRRDLPADEDEQVALLRPEADRGVVGLDRRHPDRLAAGEQRRSQPVHRVARDELDFATVDETTKDLRGGQQRLAGPEDVLRQAPPERLGRRHRVPLVREVREPEQPRRWIEQRDVEVARGHDLAQALVDRAEQGGKVPPRPGGLGDAVGTGLRALPPPREGGRLHLLLALALEEPGHESEADDRGGHDVEGREEGPEMLLPGPGQEGQAEIGELVHGVEDEREAGKPAPDGRGRGATPEDPGGREQVGKARHEAANAAGRGCGRTREGGSDRRETREHRQREGGPHGAAGRALAAGESAGAEEQKRDLQVGGHESDGEDDPPRLRRGVDRPADGDRALDVDDEGQPACRPVAQVGVPVDPVEGAQDEDESQGQRRLGQALSDLDGAEPDRQALHAVLTPRRRRRRGRACACSS